VEILQFTLVFAYLLITCYFATNWLKFFKRQPILSPEDKFLSLVILFIAITLWPFVVPISWLELLKARKKKALHNGRTKHPKNESTDIITFPGWNTPQPPNPPTSLDPP